MLRLLVALVKSSGISLECRRLPEAEDKERVLRAVDHSRPFMPIRVALRAVGLSASRFHDWRHSRAACELADRRSCPKLSPQRLTAGETHVIREMACAEEFRHVPTGTLAMLAQRMGRAFVSAQTWYRLIQRNGWRRPRKKVHPSRPRNGIRATKPNELWHVDTTIIRLLDGTKVYLHAIIDNFSRRILAWRANDRFEVASTAILLNEAAAGRTEKGVPPKLLSDAGVENLNGGVDQLIESGLIKRVLAQTDVTFSNSMIEAWWRVLKHNWLFLNTLDSLATVRRLAGFYIEQHNSVMPHAAFSGQTPDEMYFGTGSEVGAKLEAGREESRKRRMESNRAASCGACSAKEAAA
ncbi:MAG: transposase [Planctomycetes bacterium]|nr:transposase [Planctomycetota bacterium]